MVNGKIKFDKSMPDGTFRKLLDCSRIKSAGWDRYLALEDGIKSILKKSSNQIYFHNKENNAFEI